MKDFDPLKDVGREDIKSAVNTILLRAIKMKATQVFIKPDGLFTFFPEEGKKFVVQYDQGKFLIASDAEGKKEVKIQRKTNDESTARDVAVMIARFKIMCKLDPLDMTHRQEGECSLDLETDNGQTEVFIVFAAIPESGSEWGRLLITV